MKKFAKRTTIIVCLLLISVIIALIVFGYLLNRGKFTQYVIDQVNKQIDGEVKFDSIFIDLSSGVVLKGVSFIGVEENEYINFKCKTLTIKGKVSDLLMFHIGKIAIEDSIINVDLEGVDASLTDSNISTNGEKDVSPDLKELFPEKLFIEELSITNINAHIKTADYLINISEMNLQIMDVQAVEPLKISIDGNANVSNRLNNAASSIVCEIGLKSDYSLLSDELTILDNSHLTLNKIGKFAMKGNVRSVTSNPEISCSLRSQSFILDNIPGILKDFDITDISPIVLKGECDIDLLAEGKLNRIELKTDIEVKDLGVTYNNIVYKANRFELPTETVVYGTNLDGKITSKSKFVIPECQLLSEGNEMVKFFNLPIIFTMDYPEGMRIDLGAIKGEFILDQQPILINDLITDVEIEIGLQSEEKMPYKCSIHTTVSDPMLVKGEYGYDGGVIKNTSINIMNINYDSCFRKFNHLIPKDYKDWPCNGNISFNATIDTHDSNKQELDVIAGLSFSDVEFASPDYDYFSESISGDIRLDLISNYDFKRFSSAIYGKIDPFFISLGSFSTDMRNRATDFLFEAVFDTENNSLSEINGALLYDDIGSFVISGSVTDLNHTPRFDITFLMKDLANAAFFETFIKDTIEYSSPELFNATIDGVSNVHCNLSGSLESMQIDSNITIDNGHFRFDDTSIDGFYMDFPISITYPKAAIPVSKHDVPNKNFGEIKIKNLSYNFLTIDNLEFKPVVDGNNFFIKHPLKIPVFGGTLFVNDIFVQNVISPDLNINFGFQLKDINLEQVSSAANLTPFGGTLDTSLISFKQQGDKLSSDGEMKFTLFGGDIIINDLMLTDFMSSLMGIEFSAEVHHLDLGQMSNTFREWGNVGGIINGEINNFKIVAGEPSSFNIELRTEKKRGVKQVVSASFLKSFVPGIGSALDTFGFTSYNYIVMGLQAKLENDYITFKGAVNDEGRELFMKGAGLKKLDIVFNNVDRNIKFSRFLGSFESIMKSDFNETKVEAE